MRKGRMENWQEVNFCGQVRIYGNIYECDAFEEGEEMITSELVKYHNVLCGYSAHATVIRVAETKSGSMYTLGRAAENPRTLKEIFAEYADTEVKKSNHSYN